MSENIKVICDREDIVAIADATREATGNSSPMTLRQIANEVSGLSTGTSSAAIEEHNTSGTAHSDIRQSISQLSFGVANNTNLATLAMPGSLKWDGTIGDREHIILTEGESNQEPNAVFVHISDELPEMPEEGRIMTSFVNLNDSDLIGHKVCSATVEDCENGCYIIFLEVDAESGLCFVGISTDNYVLSNVTFPKKGIYAAALHAGSFGVDKSVLYPSALSIAGYSFKQAGSSDANKYFEKSTSSTKITWDGSTDGREHLLGIYYKVSDMIPTEEELLKGFSITMTIGGMPLTYRFSAPEINEDILAHSPGHITLLGGTIYIFIEPVEGCTPGIYFVTVEEDGIIGYVSELSYNKTTLETIKTEYLPKALRFGETEYRATAFDEIAFTASTKLDNDCFSYTTSPDKLKIKTPTTLLVNFDGVEYECKPICITKQADDENSDNYLWGNLYYVSSEYSDYPDTGEPFALELHFTDGSATFYTPDNSSHTISATSITTKVVTIDPKYLPSSEDGSSLTAISTHNSSTSAHADIRNQISQLSSEKVAKTNISLGIASDGLMYIFIDGVPVGTGIPQGVSGDVFGYVDENNTIVLNGNLVDGTYTVKYEMNNGSTVNIGNMVLDSTVYYNITSTLTNCTSSNNTKTIAAGSSYSATLTANSGYTLKSVIVTMGGSPVSVSNGVINVSSVTGNIIITAVAEANKPAYTNLLPLATNADGTAFVGPNGEKGYKSGYKISTSQGTESATTGAYVSGFMPITGLNDVIRIANITLSNTVNINNFVFYDANKNKIGNVTAPGSAGAFHESVEVKDGYYMAKPHMWLTVNPAFFRFSCGGITDETIVTVNEEIVETDTPTTGYKNLADPTSTDWQDGYRLSISSGTTSELAGHITTNYIPCEMGDTLRVKGLWIADINDNTNGGSDNCKILWFKSNKEKINGMYGSMPVINSTTYGAQVAVNGDIQTYTIILDSTGKQMATSGTAYIRIDGKLMDGYTKNDVIITVNEEIT